MQYEVEKRSKIRDEKHFDELKNYLDEQAKVLGKKEMKSFLFREPTFLRIRLIAGKDKAIITEKKGDYTQAGRQEDEHEISLGDIASFVSEKEKEGYKECSLVHTTRYSYECEGLKVELNKIDHLGLIVEIEGLTPHEKEILGIEKKVDQLMSQLNLEPLDAQKYQGMMDNMYKETLMPTSNHTFVI